MFEMHMFPFLSQTLKQYSCNVMTCTMRYVANCDTICNIFFQDDVDEHSEFWIWIENDFNPLVTVYEINALHLF